MVPPIGGDVSSLHDPSEVRRPAACNDRLENALIAIIAIVALIFLGGQVSKTLRDVGHSI